LAENELEISTPRTLGTHPDYVLQHHAISRSRYNLSANARKLTAMAMSLLPHDLSARTVRFTMNDFIQSLNLVKGGNLYTILEQAVNECMGTYITINNKDLWEKFTWFTYSSFNKLTGEITMSFSDSLAVYLIELKKMYAKIELEDLGRLSSRYALRIYELAVSWSSLAGKYGNAIDCWYFENKIEELRDLFAVNPDMYKQTKDFRRRVIEGPIEEINRANIGIEIKPVYIKMGKFLHSVRFECKRVPRVQELPGLFAETPESLEEKEYATLQQMYPEDYKQYYEEEINTPGKAPLAQGIREMAAAGKAMMRLKEKHGPRK
jgi:plasmid replication initiation protein